MEQNRLSALFNSNLVRVVLILTALAAFVIAAGAPLCMGNC